MSKVIGSNCHDATFCPMVKKAIARVSSSLKGTTPLPFLCCLLMNDRSLFCNVVIVLIMGRGYLIFNLIFKKLG